MLETILRARPTRWSSSQVAELLEQFPAEQRIAVVDNSGDVDDISELLAARPRGRYVHGAGQGFGQAATLGARTSTADYVVFCNPDTRPTPAVLDQLVQVLEDDPECASCSALPVDEHGRGRLGAAGWEPTPRRAAVHALGLYRLWPGAGMVARPSPHQPLHVDWLTGACLAVRRQTFLDLGGFDEAFYVYAEDISLGRAIRSRGLRQVLRTDLLVPHAGGGSGAPSLEMNRLKGASMAIYLAKHNEPRRAAVMRVLMVVGYVLRVVERLLHADTASAREHLAYVRGIVTSRASVAGVEVAHR